MASEFLTSVTVQEALAKIDLIVFEPGQEFAGLDSAGGRILAEDILSPESIPGFARSLVDGYAVVAKDIQGARETSPAFLKMSGEVRIGEPAGAIVREGSCVRVSTGSMVPEGADGIVMQEYVRAMDDEVEVTRPVHKGENIVYAGEDISAGATVMKKGKKISPFDLGVLAAIGAGRVRVFKRPEIALLSSGDEIVPVDENPPFGKIRDINRHTVAGLVRSAGSRVEFAGLALDTIEDITEKLSSAARYDMILISGGSSKGERDHITDSILKLGGEVIFHGINIKPGKPTIFGRVFGKPVFGLPGHPVSCAMVTVRFVVPLLKRMAGKTPGFPLACSGTLATNVPSSYGIEEYVRVKVSRKGDAYLVEPVFAKSSVISSLSAAHGYIIVPDGVEGLEKDERVEVYPFEENV
jgi:molybdopterin molybdotransferase